MKELLEYLIKNWYFYRLLGMARKRWGKVPIVHCPKYGSMFECVLLFRDQGILTLWYDTPDKSTHIETIRYKKVRK